MFKSKSFRFICAMLFVLINSNLLAGDVLLEFRAAYFFPTNSTFRHIYGNGSALFGPEVTFQLGCNEYLYGFASIDFFTKKGHSIGLSNRTNIFMMPLTVGLKFFVPVNCVDFYLGLGFQPTYVKTNDHSAFVKRHNTKWGFGGLVKGGTYINVYDNLLIDLFAGYSFVRAGHNHELVFEVNNVLETRRANISGAVLGAGLAYCF